MLIQQGYNVHCVAFNDSEEYAEHLKNMGCLVYMIKKNSLILDAMLMNINLAKLIFKYRNDYFLIVHFISTFILFFPSIFFNASRVHLVVEGIGTFFTKNTKLQKLLKLLICKFTKTRTFMNSSEKDLLGTKNDLVLKGIGIDLDKFKYSLDSSKNINYKHRVLYVGRLVSDKGILDVIELCRLLLLERVDFHIDIVGDIYKSNPTSLTEDDVARFSQQFHDVISFHGFKSDLIPYYKNASILVLPSQHEGFPVVVMEANALGVPAIVYDVIGCNDAVISGVNGYLVSKNNVVEIKDLIVNHEYSSLSKSSYIYAKNNFDQNVKSETFLKYLDLIES